MLFLNVAIGGAGIGRCAGGNESRTGCNPAFTIAALLNAGNVSACRVERGNTYIDALNQIELKYIYIFLSFTSNLTLYKCG
jgi:hypothetical protein